MPGPKTPAALIEFKPGPSLTPAAQLLDWLNIELKATPKRRIQLPVVIRFKDKNLYTIRDAFIGAVPDSEPEKDAIFLALDDSLLGLSRD